MKIGHVIVSIEDLVEILRYFLDLWLKWCHITWDYFLGVHRGICENVKGTITLGVVKWPKSSKLIKWQGFNSAILFFEKKIIFGTKSTHFKFFFEVRLYRFIFLFKILKIIANVENESISQKGCRIKVVCIMQIKTIPA